MARTKNSSPRIRSLGAELREYREASGWTVRAVAEKLGGHHSKYARFETGEQAPTPEQVSALLATYGASESERERLSTMARDTEESNWLKPNAGIDQELTSLIEFERTAAHVVDVAPIMIPGLMQTADYARAVMSGGMSPAEVEAQTTMRVGRRDVLNRRNAPTLTAIIGEWALYEPMGDREVMADQLQHIVKMADMENVTVHVLRNGSGQWTPAHAGPFMLFDFPKAAPIVHLEHLSSSAFLSAPGDIRVYRDAAVNLRDVAMSPTDSAELIASIATDMEVT